MKRLTNAEFNELMRRRTFDFALRTLQFLEKCERTIPRVISYQLSKSATSVGANFRAFCRGRSAKERYAKICIVVEESDETCYWFDLIQQGKFNASGEIEQLIAEAGEVLRLVATIKRGHER